MKQPAISRQPSAVGNGVTSPELNAESRKLTARRYRTAFTLIELLAVITIIVILAGLVVGISKYAWRKAGTSRAQAEIAAMEGALENYKIDNGRYPVSTGASRADNINNSVSLYKALAGQSKVYFNFRSDGIRVISANTTNVVDPFGTPYNYYCQYPPAVDQTNQASFDLWSYGPNGVNDEGLVDDITNWRQ